MAEKSCPNCQMPASLDAKRCSNCGVGLDGSGTQPIGSVGVPSSERAPVAAPASVPSGHRAVCPTCGWIAPRKKDRCAHCETPYGSAPLLVSKLSDQRFWVGAEAAFTCHACGHLSPVNHLDTDGTLLCLHCGREQAADPNQWWGALAHAHAVGDLAGPHPEGRFGNEMVSIRRHNPFAEIGVSKASAIHDQAAQTSSAARRKATKHAVWLEAAPGHPLCVKCRAPLETNRVEAPLLEVRCTNQACAAVASYVLPVEVSEAAPYILGVIAREHETGCNDVRVQSNPEGVVAVRCPKCSAALDVSSLTTLVECRHCSTTSRVTREALRFLGFERPKRETFWLLMRGPSKLRSKLERQARRAQAKKQAPVPARNLPPAPRTAASPAPHRSKARPVLLLALVLVSSALVAAGVVLASKSTPDSVTVAVAPRSETIGDELSRSAPPEKVAPPETRDSIASPPSGATAERKSTVPAFSLEWSAKLTTLRGRGPKNGAPCVIKARIVDAAPEWVIVACTGETLYDSRTPLNGMSMHHFELYEVASPGASTWQYRLKYADTGPRQGRSQVTLNSFAEQGVVWSDAVPTFRVELRLLPDSAVREGEPLYDTPRDAKPAASKLEVTAKRGPAPSAVSAACEVASSFVMSGANGPQCKTRLLCAGKPVYGKGTSGYGPCRIENGKVIAFEDATESYRDADPAFEFDLTTKTASLSDSPDGDAYRVDFRAE